MSKDGLKACTIPKSCDGLITQTKFLDQNQFFNYLSQSRFSFLPQIHDASPRVSTQALALDVRVRTRVLNVTLVVLFNTWDVGMLELGVCVYDVRRCVPAVCAPRCFGLTCPLFALPFFFVNLSVSVATPKTCVRCQPLTRPPALEDGMRHATLNLALLTWPLIFVCCQLQLDKLGPTLSASVLRYQC
jgi:hypothetical protein